MSLLELVEMMTVYWKMGNEHTAARSLHLRATPTKSVGLGFTNSNCKMP
jgi:hypothetical protein